MQVLDPSPALASEDMERCLAHAEEVVRSSRANPDGSRRLLEECVAITRADSAALWLVDEADITCLTQTEGYAAESVNATELRTVLRDPAAASVSTNGAPISGWSYASWPFGPQSGLVLELRRTTNGLRTDHEILQFLNALLELLALDFLRGQFVGFQQATRLQEAYAQSLRTLLLRDGIADVAHDITAVVRDLTGADRVSLVAARRYGGRVLSNATTVAPAKNSTLLRAQRKLALEALNRNLACEFQVGSGTEFPTGIRGAMQRYIDESGAQIVRLEPLSGREDSARPVGMLILEGFTGEGFAREAAPGVLSLAGVVLARSLERHATTWRGRFERILGVRRILKLLAAIVLISSAAAALVLVPADLEIVAHGRLMPSLRQAVFIPEEGLVTELAVVHGQAVAAGDVLVRLSNTALDAEHERITGDLTTLRTQLAGVHTARVEQRTAEAAQRSSYSAQEEELKERIAGLERQKQLVEEQQQSLTVRSPMRGLVNEWDLERRLTARPVVRGQYLMEIVDSASDWVLELDIPDATSGYVYEQQRMDGPAAVRFVLRTDPTHVHAGTVASLSESTLIDAEGKLSVRALVPVTDEVPRRIGASVIARIHCGRRPIGFVWFRELVEFWQQYLAW
ncbi:MAG: biotin/lipoyl-binding protein [Planctomycetaceae bacterium]|nr:biotin/lipoyl-binding protein [Planctomycetaceae bacterium]